MDDTFEDQVRGTWRRCLIQFVATDYITYMYENQPSRKQTTTDKENRSLYLCLRDMFPCILLYPHVLCELKKIVDLSHKIETSSGCRPPPIKIDDFFTDMIKGFGSTDDIKGVSEEELLLSILNPKRWGNPEKKHIEEVIHSAGLMRLIEALRNVPGLIHPPNKSLDMGIRDHILNDWARLTDPKTWGVHIVDRYLNGAILLELSLKNFKLEMDGLAQLGSFAQLGVLAIHALAGGYMV